MSISRFNVKIGAKGNASPHHSYICGLDQYDKKGGIEFTQSGNMPQWAQNDPAKFWRAADEHERANGTTYKEHTLSLPRELDKTQHIKIVERWIEKEIGDKHPYTFALHHSRAKDGGINPHAHLMYSQRTNDGIERDSAHYFKRANKKNPERGGAVKSETNMTKGQLQAHLVAQRERWGEHLRECLREFGRDDLANKVDMRNWKDRGLDEPPQNKTMAEIQIEKKLDTIIENHPYYLSMTPPAPKPQPKPKPEPPPPPPPPPPKPEPVIVGLPVTASYIPDGNREPYQRPTVAIGHYRDYREFQSAYVRYGQVNIDLTTMKITSENISERYPQKFEEEFKQKLELHAQAFLGRDDQGNAKMGFKAYNEHLQRTHGTTFQCDKSFHPHIAKAYEYLDNTPFTPPTPETKPAPSREHDGLEYRM